jgi:carbamoyl-phosphate synthase large subunit
MTGERILVTAVGGDLGQSIIQCLRDSPYGTHLLGCDTNPYAAGRAAVDTFLVAPPVHSMPAYLDFLRRACREHGVGHIIPASDIEIMTLHARRAEWGDLVGALIMCAPPLLDLFSDKYATAQFFAAHGQPHPRSVLPGEWRGQLPFPLIVKRRQGSGSQQLFVVRDQPGLDAALQACSQPLIQEYLGDESHEYTAGLYRQGDRLFTIAFRRQLARGGYSQEVSLEYAAAIDSFLQDLAAVIDFTGTLNVQFRRHAGGYVPFEINPRFSSTVHFRHVFGFRDVVWTLDDRAGKSVAYQPRYRRGVGVKAYHDVFFDLEGGDAPPGGTP